MLELMNSVARVAFPGATIRVAASLTSAQSSARSMADLDMVLLDRGRLDLGASGFIMKSLGISVPALRLVAQGGIYNQAVLATTPLSPIMGTGA
jgi:hypothetical protein